MARVYLLMIAIGLFPIALSYGLDPTSTLPKLFGFPVEAPNETQLFRVYMCLYIGMCVFCALATFRREWQHVAMIWAVIFMVSLASGRVLSILLDGMPASLLNWYLAVEAAMAGFGLWILARQDTKPGLKR
jgi:amino acid permease